MAFVTAVVCGITAWGASLSRIETKFMHFAHAELDRPVATRLDGLNDRHPHFPRFAAALHDSFDRHVRTLVEEVVCRQALTEDDAPELMLRLGILRARLRHLLIVTSWLAPGEDDLDELRGSFEAFFSLPSFDSVNGDLEDWKTRLEGGRRAVSLADVIGEARRVWLARAGESPGGVMTGKTTDRLQ